MFFTERYPDFREALSSEALYLPGMLTSFLKFSLNSRATVYVDLHEQVSSR